MEINFKQIVIVGLLCLCCSLAAMFIDRNLTEPIDITQSKTIVNAEIKKLNKYRNQTTEILKSYRDSLAQSNAKINELSDEILTLSNSQNQLRNERKTQSIDSIYLQLLDSIYAYKFRARKNYVLPNTE